MHKAGQASRHWDFYGPAFSGVVGIDINSTNGLIAGNFTSVPEVTFIGETLNPYKFADPDFKPAKAEAILNARGEVSRLKVLDSGHFTISPQPDGEIQANANVIIEDSSFLGNCFNAQCRSYRRGNWSWLVYA